jgi:hypothetical protein
MHRPTSLDHFKLGHLLAQPSKSAATLGLVPGSEAHVVQQSHLLAESSKAVVR